mgnify:FL=1
MNQNTVSGDIIAFNLKQLGATDIKVFDSRMHIANFDLGNGLVVSYVFNITRKDKFFLQRMRPYAMVKGKYADQREIIEFIKDDITRLKCLVSLTILISILSLLKRREVLMNVWSISSYITRLMIRLWIDLIQSLMTLQTNWKKYIRTQKFSRFTKILNF